MKKYYEILNDSSQYEEMPPGYLTDVELIQLLNKKNVKIERTDNICRFANNNNIKMARLLRDGSFGSPPTIFQKPSDSKIQEILEKHKNNNNSLIGREILEKKKKKILEIFDNSPSAKDYDKKMEGVSDEKKSEIRKIKWEKCMTRTLIAKKVSELLGVNCNRKLVASILDKKRSSQLDKLLKKE
tara:strand:+ start:481 stop:1035 length:555 start_codon:yes stop_codon:yes gene_type:complete